MDLMLLRMFQHQILLQCDWMILAAQDLNDALQAGNSSRIFFSLQNLLNAGANVSKALWGQGGNLVNERKPIRDSIGVSDSSPLRNVTMRNNFEHFDERLDKWWQQSEARNNFDLVLTSRKQLSGIDDLDWFRVFDPHSTDMTFWSQDFNIQEIINEVQRILPKLREEASKHYAEPQPPERATGTPPDGATPE